MLQAATLYRQFLDGDRQALAQLIGLYKDGLILYLFDMVGDLQTAEELTEDTFVKLGIKRPRYNEKASFKTWLYTIARNVARDHMRRVSRRREVPLETTVAEGDREELERAVIRQEQRRALHRAMDGLKSEYRQILWLIYFEEFTYKEAAQVMCRTVHSTEVLASRARAALKKALGKEGFVYEEL